MSKLIDMTGQKIGAWKVLTRAENDKRGRAQWLCECSLCGKQKVVSGINLRGGQSYSCGCTKMEKMRQSCIKDETDKTYGYLHVLRQATPQEKQLKIKGHTTNGVYWVCECLKCGNPYFIVKGDYLRNGDTKSCGCLTSKNEVKIATMLNKLNLLYKTQYTFLDLTSTGRGCDRLMFDFAILNSNNEVLYLIEYDGEQHFYQENTWNLESFIATCRNDDLKNNYCFNNNIPLIRIPFLAQQEYNEQDLQLSTTRFLLTQDNIKQYYQDRVVKE